MKYQVLYEKIKLDLWIICCWFKWNVEPYFCKKIETYLRMSSAGVDVVIEIFRINLEAIGGIDE